MSRFKKPFSELFGVSPGDYSSPGVCQIIFESKVVSMILASLLAAFVVFACSMNVDAKTVSGNDNSFVPGPTTSPEPAPNYTIENEVNLDGANLYSSSDSVTVYTQAVILASEENGTSNASTFPEKSGYFVVPVSETECVYVPEGYAYWAVFYDGSAYFSAVSGKEFFLHMDDSLQCFVMPVLNNLYRYSASGDNLGVFSFSSDNLCSHGHMHALYWASTCVKDVVAGTISQCAAESVPEDILLESIVLSSDAIEFVDMSSQSLVALLSPSDFVNTITWTSTDETVARYSGGLVIPVANGECQIIASYVNPDGSVVSAACSITVSVPAVEEEPTELDAFLQEPIEVDRYQYEILKRLEFVQYALAIQVALIFILIFKRK